MNRSGKVITASDWNDKQINKHHLMYCALVVAVRMAKNKVSEVCDALSGNDEYDNPTPAQNTKDSPFFFK